MLDVNGQLIAEVEDDSLARGAIGVVIGGMMRTIKEFFEFDDRVLKGPGNY